MQAGLMRKVVAIAAATGAFVGIFWLFAIDAGVNGARWPPNWHSWPAHVTCPFIPVVGLSPLANILVPVLNALVYGLLAWGVFQVQRQRQRAS